MVTLGEDVDQPDRRYPPHTETLAISVWGVKAVDILRYPQTDQEAEQNRDVVKLLRPYIHTNIFGK